MKKLVFLLTLMAFMMSAAFAVARDQNRDSLMQAWAAIQAQEQKAAAAEKAASEKAKAAEAEAKSKKNR